ncbi:hypothetical protein [Phytoactinopolyspora limicola]|uniref:hypothetical protein n=1 Tax=Phytoactinopolyspora limicola TaxID=2715536 RepID=UPI00140BE77D|nr:hypothetical protein [Phytoactinopolyspora limicola]
MTGISERRKLIAVVAVAAAAVVIVAIGAAAIGLLADRDDDAVATQDADDDATPSPSDDASDDEQDVREGDPSNDGDETDAAEERGDVAPNPAGADFLSEPMSGQEAIDALGDDLEAVARLNHRDVDELRDLLLRDSTLHVSPSGFLLYIDTATPNAPGDD